MGGLKCRVGIEKMETLKAFSSKPVPPREPGELQVYQ